MCVQRVAKAWRDLLLGYRQSLDRSVALSHDNFLAFGAIHDSSGMNEAILTMLG